MQYNIKCKCKVKKWRKRRATFDSGEFGEILCGSEYSLLNAVFLYCKHRQVRCKKKHILPPTGGNFTSEAIAERLHKRNEMERLHKQGGTEF